MESEEELINAEENRQIENAKDRLRVVICATREEETSFV